MPRELAATLSARQVQRPTPSPSRPHRRPSGHLRQPVSVSLPACPDVWLASNGPGAAECRSQARQGDGAGGRQSRPLFITADDWSDCAPSLSAMGVAPRFRCIGGAARARALTGQCISASGTPPLIISCRPVSDGSGAGASWERACDALCPACPEPATPSPSPRCTIDASTLLRLPRLSHDLTCPQRRVSSFRTLLCRAFVCPTC